jgi:hypothetical protein
MGLNLRFEIRDLLLGGGNGIGARMKRRDGCFSFAIVISAPASPGSLTVVRSGLSSIRPVPSALVVNRRWTASVAKGGFVEAAGRVLCRIAQS